MQAAYVLYLYQLAVYVVVGVVAVRLQSGQFGVTYEVLQHGTPAAAVVVEEDGGLCQPVHKAPDVHLTAGLHQMFISRPSMRIDSIWFHLVSIDTENRGKNRKSEKKFGV